MATAEAVVNTIAARLQATAMASWWNSWRSSGARRPSRSGGDAPANATPVERQLVLRIGINLGDIVESGI
jgi:hypothetical protein